jgi:hypothetical protein
MKPIKILLCSAVVLLCVGAGLSKLPREAAACHHDGSFNGFKTSETWRVDMGSCLDGQLEVGVCKKCGALVDWQFFGTNPPVLMHFPYPPVVSLMDPPWRGPHETIYDYKYCSNLITGCTFIGEGLAMRDVEGHQWTNSIFIGDGAKPLTATAEDELVIAWDDGTFFRQHLPHKRVAGSR